jgi:hypothetical protein
VLLIESNAQIGKATGRPIMWFRCDEIGSRTGRFHIHALVAGVSDVSRMTWLQEWNRRSGWARILAFDPAQGGARYCAKYLLKDLGDWEFVGSPAKVGPVQSAMFPLDGAIRRRPVEERPVLHHSGIPLAGRFRRADWESLMLRKGSDQTRTTPRR